MRQNDEDHDQGGLCDPGSAGPCSPLWLGTDTYRSNRRSTVRYLEQLLLTLRRAGILQSKRGVKGGYTLAKPPAEITLGAILQAVDGPVEPISCLAEAPRKPCPREAVCALRGVWSDIHRAVAAIVDHTTLQDICDPSQAVAAGPDDQQLFPPTESVV